MAALGVAVGDVLPIDQAAVLQRLRAVAGVQEASISLITPSFGPGQLQTVIFVGIDEVGRAPRHAQVARGAILLPPELLELHQLYRRKSAAAMQAGRVGEDHSEGHSLDLDPATRAIQEEFIDIAEQDGEMLAEVLRTSATAQHRAIAAQMIAYSLDKQELCNMLVAAMRDADGSVRNNVIRALGVLASYAVEHPELGIELDSAPFVELLNSPVWTDRNKGLFVLVQWTRKGDPVLFETLRRKAWDSLREMAAWRSAGHAHGAMLLIGRSLGIADEETLAHMQDRWAWLARHAAEVRKSPTDGK